MKTLITLTLLIAVQISSAYAGNFNPSKCATIDTVDMPYTVSLGKQKVTLNNKETSLSISPYDYRVNGDVTYIDNPGGYYALLNEFFVLSKEYSVAIQAVFGENNFKKLAELEESDWLSMATQSDDTMKFLFQSVKMCQNILSLAKANQQASFANPDFVPAINIRLRGNS